MRQEGQQECRIGYNSAYLLLLFTFFDDTP